MRLRRKRYTEKISRIENFRIDGKNYQKFVLSDVDDRNLYHIIDVRMGTVTLHDGHLHKGSLPGYPIKLAVAQTSVDMTLLREKDNTVLDTANFVVVDCF